MLSRKLNHSTVVAACAAISIALAAPVQAHVNELLAPLDAKSMCKLDGKNGGEKLEACLQVEVPATALVMSWLQRHNLLKADGRINFKLARHPADENSPEGVMKRCWDFTLYANIKDCIDRNYGIDR